MSYTLQSINYKTVMETDQFILESEYHYKEQVEKAAEMIAENTAKSPIVLLAGPSGSGKTTTAKKVCESLAKKGFTCHSIGMDDYFIDVDPETYPRNPDGTYDFERPSCVDMELLRDHFDKLSKGEPIDVPKFDFTVQKRMPGVTEHLEIGKSDVVIFEGIHALNPMITDTYPDAFRLYVAAISDVEFNDEIVFKNTWIRLLRRMIRDSLTRGRNPATTVVSWDSVRNGEKKYITPYKDTAHIQIDTVHPYEMAMMNHLCTKMFSEIPKDTVRYDEIKSI